MIVLYYIVLLGLLAMCFREHMRLNRSVDLLELEIQNLLFNKRGHRHENTIPTGETESSTESEMKTNTVLPTKDVETKRGKPKVDEPQHRRDFLQDKEEVEVVASTVQEPAFPEAIITSTLQNVPVYLSLPIKFEAGGVRPLQGLRGRVAKQIDYALKAVKEVSFIILGLRESVAIDNNAPSAEVFLQSLVQTNKKGAEACYHALPSCLQAVRALDRKKGGKSSSARNKRWGVEPAVRVTDVVALVEHDILVPLLTDLKRRVAAGTTKPGMLKRLLTQKKNSAALLASLTWIGAYRSAVLLAQACTLAGHRCANAMLKDLERLPNLNAFTGYHNALRKWGKGHEHTRAIAGLSPNEAADMILSAPLDLTWGFPALTTCTDLLATKATGDRVGCP